MTAHQPQAEARRKLLAAARLARPAFARNGHALPRAFFLTDPKRAPDPADITARLPRGFGVIYRHFGAADRRETALKLAKICRRRGLVLLIAADPVLARQVGASGVHWPGRMLGKIAGGARSGRGRWLETASAHNPRDISRARRAGVDAVLLSAVFASDSPSAGLPMGPLRFAMYVQRAGLPVYALGGVAPDNAARTIVAGAAGWAAISAVADAWS